MNKIPMWFWWVLEAALLLLVLALLKFDFSIGSSGVHFIQHLINP